MYDAPACASAKALGRLEAARAESNECSLPATVRGHVRDAHSLTPLHVTAAVVHCIKKQECDRGGLIRRVAYVLHLFPVQMHPARPCARLFFTARSFLPPFFFGLEAVRSAH